MNVRYQALGLSFKVSSLCAIPLDPHVVIVDWWCYQTPEPLCRVCGIHSQCLVAFISAKCNLPLLRGHLLCMH